MHATRPWLARTSEVVAVVAGAALYLGLEWREERYLTRTELLLELVELLPIVLTIVGLLLLLRSRPGRFPR